MDTEYYTCGTCRHGSLLGHCRECEDSFELKRSKIIEQIERARASKRVEQAPAVRVIRKEAP